MLRTTSLRAFLLTLTLALGASLASASVIYVNQNAPGPTHDGKIWATAFLKVQAGLDAAEAGDEVWVAKGTYTEATKHISGLRDVSLYGGFVGTESTRDQRNASTNRTTLAANLGLFPSVSRYTVPRSPSVVDGFEIVGIVKCVSDVDVRISHNFIRGPVSAEGVWKNSIEISDNYIQDSVNTHEEYEVIHTRFVNATITRNTIRGTDPYLDQAFIFMRLHGRSGRVADNLLIYTGWRYAFGIFTDPFITDEPGAPAGFVVCNNTLIGDAWYAAIEATDYDIVANNIVTGTIADRGISMQEYVPKYWPAPKRSKPARPVRNNCVWIPKGRPFNPNLNGVNGNLIADPRFVAAEAGDYRLSSGSPCRDNGDDSVVLPDETDMDGFSRIQGGHVDIGAYEGDGPKQFAVSLGTPLATAPAVGMGVVYAATTDGKLHARSLADGRAVYGFPLDLSSVLGSSVTFNSRPIVHTRSTGTAVYLTTREGYVAKVSRTGQVLWSQRPLPGFTRSTPAVTKEGEVLVSLGYENEPGKALNFAFQLDEATGFPEEVSPYLGVSTPESLTDRSPAVYGRYVYINSTGESLGSLVVLDRHNLMVRASFAPGEDALPPFVSGANLFVATKAGKVRKLNAVTFNQEMGFGRYGTLDLSEGITTPPFADATGTLYVGTVKGRVYTIEPNTGEKRLFHDSGTDQPVTGLVVARSGGMLAYGSGEKLVQVPVGDASKAQVQTLDGPVAGEVVYDSPSGRFILATTPGTIHAIPAM